MMILKPAPANPPVLPGVTDMMTLYRALVERPDVVKSFLAEWESYLKRYEEVIASYGGAAKIASLQASLEQQENEAKKRSAEAAEELVRAKRMGAEIAAKAEAEANAVRVGLSQRDQELNDRAQVQDDKERAFTRMIAEREAACAKTEASLAVRENAVAAREAAVSQRIEKMTAAGIKIEL